MPIARGRAGVQVEMHKFKNRSLHSGSKKGPIVTNQKQAIAIALHEAGVAKRGPKSARRAGHTRNARQ